MFNQYRQCAGAIVFNRNGLVLLGNRIDTRTAAWQFSQGGIEAGETPEQAARRELFEEMSVVSIESVYSDNHPFRYEFPDDVKAHFRSKGIFTNGQDIYFSLFFFTGIDEEINVRTENPEFKSYRWDTLEFAKNNVVDFKKEAYLYVTNLVSPLICQYLKRLT